MTAVRSSRLYMRAIAGGIAALSTMLLATYVLLVTYVESEHLPGPALTTAALVLLYILTAVFGIYIYQEKIYEARLRRSWLLIAIAVLVSAMVDILWAVYSNFNIQPAQGLTEILSLTYYPLVLLAILSYPFNPDTRQERLIFWMDIIIVATALGMYLWVFILNTLQTLMDVYPSGIYSVTFPVANLLLVAGFVALMQRNVKRMARWTLLFLASGALCGTLADGWFVYCQISGQPCNLTFLNILSLGAALGALIAAALQIVLQTDSKTSYSEGYKPFSPVLRLVIPYLAVAAGWGLLIYMVYMVGYADQRVLGALYGSIVLVFLVLARQFMVLQENVRLYHEMERLAVTDSLTGLYNRHFFNETLGREIERSKRYNSPLSILLMDVDNFKLFNDTYGHLQGDDVLKIMARLLAGQLRKADILARFGGDEFAIILPETNRGGAISVAKKMERAVSQQKYKDWRLGLCVGAGIFHQGMTLEELIEQADRNLYKHKASKTSAQIIKDAEWAAGISQTVNEEPEPHVELQPRRSDYSKDR